MSDDTETEEEGHRVLPGVQGIEGPEGPIGKTAPLPGGAFRLTDKRLILIYAAIILGVAFCLWRTNAVVDDANLKNFETCVQFRAIITDITAERATALELPNCERLRP